jgi:hypothetical protein
LPSELRIVEERPPDNSRTPARDNFRENYVVVDSSGRRGIVKEDPNNYINQLLLNPKPTTKQVKKTKYYINDD